jgi:hypothetical protein
MGSNDNLKIRASSKSKDKKDKKDKRHSVIKE